MSKQKKIMDSHQLRFELIHDIYQCNTESLGFYVNEFCNFDATSKELGINSRIKGDPLRSIKNHILSLNSMCCLAAEYGGIDAIKSHYLAEKYAILIEEASTLEQLSLLTHDFLSEYLDPCNRQNFNDNQSLSDKIDIFIRGQFMYDISVEMIADHLLLSREHISRTYRKETAKSINDAINLLRISEAKHFLRYSQLSMTDIAETVGFNSSQYFSNVFKKYVGISPSEYRNN